MWLAAVSLMLLRVLSIEQCCRMLQDEEQLKILALAFSCAEVLWVAWAWSECGCGFWRPKDATLKTAQWRTSTYLDMLWLLWHALTILGNEREWFYRDVWLVLKNCKPQWLSYLSFNMFQHSASNRVTHRIQPLEHRAEATVRAVDFSIAWPRKQSSKCMARMSCLRHMNPEVSWSIWQRIAIPTDFSVARNCSVECADSYFVFVWVEASLNCL